MRVSYEILALEVDKMYPPHYVLKPNETLDEHLADVEALIQACGWTVEEYIEEYIHRGVQERFPEQADMN